MKKHYLGLNYVFPIASDQSLTTDFNGYKSDIDDKFVKSAGLNGDSNTIWSLAATYAYGAHSFTIAHQRSTGSTGYNYGWYQNEGGVGDGGSTIYPPTRTGPTSTPKTSVLAAGLRHGLRCLWHPGSDLQAGLRGG